MPLNDKTFVRLRKKDTGTLYGPMEIQDIKYLITSKLLEPHDQISAEQDEWQNIDFFEDLRSLFEPSSIQNAELEEESVESGVIPPDLPPPPTETVSIKTSSPEKVSQNLRIRQLEEDLKILRQEHHELIKKYETLHESQRNASGE